MTRWLLGIVLVAAVLISSLWISQHQHAPKIVSGFIEADEIRLGSRVGGRVQRVLIEEGQEVAAGELLVELEPFDLVQRRAEAEALWNQKTTEHEKLVEGFRKEEIAQAQARYDQAEANLKMLQNGPRPQELETARAELNLALAELELTEEVYGRTIELHKQGAATQDALDRATKERRTASEGANARREQLELLQAGTRVEEIDMAQARVREAKEAWQLMATGYRTQDVAEAYSAMKAAESALAVIDKQLEELQVRAPGTGVIEAVELQPGDLVSANAPALSLIDTGHLWVRAYVPENELDIAVGQQLPVTVDSFPGERFDGVVTFIARQAEFTPGNVQTPEDRSKQVFRIKVELQNPEGKLRPGMAADVWLEETR